MLKMHRCRICGGAAVLVCETRRDVPSLYAVQCVNERCENSDACEWYRDAEQAVNTWNERNKR